jgi:hypothetical protein
METGMLSRSLSCGPELGSKDVFTLSKNNPERQVIDARET